MDLLSVSSLNWTEWQPKHWAVVAFATAAAFEMLFPFDYDR